MPFSKKMGPIYFYLFLIWRKCDKNKNIILKIIIQTLIFLYPKQERNC